MGVWSRIGSWFGGTATGDREGQQYAAPSHYSIESIKTVTEETALQLSAVWACVRLLSETVASLPLNVYELKENGRELADESRIFHLLHHKPNGRMTSLEWRETMMLNLCMYGNAYAKIERNQRGEITALWPLSAYQMRVAVDENNDIVYLYNTDSGDYPFEKRDILHIKLFGNGNVGLSPLAYARSTFGLSMAAEDYSSRFYSNGGKPGGVLSIDQILKPEQREIIRKNFSDIHGGSANAHKLFVLEAGMKYQQVQINPEDAQMLQTRRMQTEEIARWFGVPSFLINDTANSTSWGSGIEQMMLGFYQLNLRPWLTRWEQALTNGLLTPSERRKLKIEFDFEGLLRASTEAQGKYHATMVQNGLMTRNEVRGKRNLPQVEGGDELTAQVNLAPLDKLGEGSGDAQLVQNPEQQ